jgi:hypothetical protein
MMTEEQATVSAGMIGEMARLAGLHAGPERVDRLRDEYRLALEAVRELDEAVPETLPGAEATMAFDAAWPEHVRGAS